MPWGIPEIWAIGLVVVVVIAVIFYGLYRLGVFQDDDHDSPPEGTELVDRSGERGEDYRIPLREKPKQLPPMLKMSLVAVLLAMVVVGYYAFLFLRSGNPVEIRYASQMQAILVIALAGMAGVKIKDIKDRRLGVLYVEYEAQDHSELENTEKIYFDVARAKRDDEGNLVIHELFSTDILGLFHRRKQAGHDRNLRSKRPLGDFVRHQIPPHALALDGERVYLLRTKGRKTIDSPTGPADYTYRPPVELPYRAYRNQKRQMYQMDLEMSMLKSQLAAAEDELREAMEQIREEEYQDKKELLELFEDFADVFQTGERHVHVQRDNGVRRHDDGQEDAGERLESAGQGGQR